MVAKTARVPRLIALQQHELGKTKGAGGAYCVGLPVMMAHLEVAGRAGEGQVVRLKAAEDILGL